MIRRKTAGPRERRSLKSKLTNILHEMRANPCDGDGGMEFNGYHCYNPNFKAKPGLSWWWVNQEDFLVTLGPLKGYEVVRTLPFSRYIGPKAAIHVLRPLPCVKTNPKLWW